MTEVSLFQQALRNSGLVTELKGLIEKHNCTGEGYFVAFTDNLRRSFDMAGTFYLNKGIAMLWIHLGGDMEYERFVNHCHGNGLVLNTLLQEIEAELLSSLPSVQTQPQTQTEMKGNTNMSTPAFETKNYVYGRDVSLMSEAELIEAIKKIEAEIENLKSVKTESVKIKAKIEELQAMLADVVKALDAK